MLANRDGRFKARILDHGVDETGPNKLATFTANFALVQELVGGEWEPVQEELEITGYFYLEKKDGSVNQSQVDKLKEALGWDGRDILWLQDADLSQTLVQVTLGFEEYNGKSRLKVQWIDAEDARPSGVTKADDATRRTLANRLGSKLRAMSGGTPAPAPKPAGKPTPPARAAAPNAATSPTAPKSPAKKTATQDKAWAHFRKLVPQGWQQENTAEEWFRILDQLFPGAELEKLTGEQWAEFIEKAAGLMLPI